MGNENKIKGDELVLRKREEFFKDGIIDSSSAENLYSLAEEYAKTKKVRQFFLYLSVLVFIGSLVLGTLFMTMSIRKSAKQIAIDIKEFESVNLAELLTTAKKNEGLIRGLNSEIKDLKRQRDTELASIRDNLYARRNLLTTMNISGAEKKRRSRRYGRQAALQSARVRAAYGKKIQPKEQRIRDLKAQMAKSGRMLKKTQAAIDNFQRLWEIEEKKLHLSYAKRIGELKAGHLRQMAALKRFHKKYVSSLILRFNPVFKDDVLKQLIAAVDGSRDLKFNPWNDLLARERVTSRNDFDGLRQKIRNDFLLIKRLERISYTNSVAPALGRIDVLTATIVTAYEELWKTLLVTVAAKNYLLGEFRNALSSYAKQTREHGYIVSARNRNAVILVMNENYPVTDGMKGIVIRGDRQKIATIDLYKTREGVRARNVQSVSNFRIKPLDKILIKLQ